jgi:hypothetical protein
MLAINLTSKTLTRVPVRATFLIQTCWDWMDNSVGIMAIIMIEMNKKDTMAPCEGRWHLMTKDIFMECQVRHCSVQRFSTGMVRHPIETSSTAFRLCVLTGRQS